MICVYRVEEDATLYNGFCDSSVASKNDSMMLCDCFKNSTCTENDIMFSCTEEGGKWLF